MPLRRPAITLAALAALAASCSRQGAGAPSGQGGGDGGVAPSGIGTEGGTFGAGRARVTVPKGAVRATKTYTMQRMTGAALEKGWPRGTAAGYVFEPAGEHFRIPAMVELPHEGGIGEVMCQPVSGAQITVPFDADEEGEVYRFHVNELPRRCLVYTPERTATLNAAREREGALVAKLNDRHDWQIQSEMCNPNFLARVNSGRALREPAGVDGCPSGMAPIPGKPACVDRWEAHVVQVLEDGSARSWSPFFNPQGLKIRARSAPGAIPQGYITQAQAAAACLEAKKRLCSDTEWVAACRGSKNTQFPYGNDEKAASCNDRRDKHPAIEYLESTDVYSKLEHPCINQVPESVLPAGAKAECVTPEGVFDMVGNLHEWTADANGTFRGGYYVEAKLNGRGCGYVTTRHDTAYWDYSIGFRCCADRKGS